MKIKQNENLALYTTFQIGGPAKFFCVAKNLTEIREALAFAEKEKVPTLVLGGGSNVLINDKGFNGLVVKIEIKGWEAKTVGDSVVLNVSAGETWDDIVSMCVKKGWWGIENLSHIPGRVGAFAVQNVGAYGQDSSQVIEQVTVLEKRSMQIFTLDKYACGFSYRKSIFNTTRKNQFVILSVTFRLSKIPKPNLWYRDLNLKFLGKKPTLPEIRKAVIEIRDEKFPFPNKPKCGNAGSFFKNLILPVEQLPKIKTRIEKSFGKNVLLLFESKVILMHDHAKISAAFLLDICGLKNLKNSGVKINPTQPLVIINYSGKAKAADVLSLAKQAVESVYKNTGILLELEPELIGFSEKELNAIIKAAN